MTDTVMERDVMVPTQTDATRTPFSWSAAIAGALAATAVTFIVVSLGSGIGLSFASPYSSALSATGLSVFAAVWLVMAQTMGFATGGYLAGRLRSPARDGVIGETTFRDGVQGFMVWAIGVVAMAAIAGLLGLFAAGATAQVATGVAAGTAASSRGGPGTPVASATDYFVDLMFRPRPAPAAAGGQAPPSENATVGMAPAGAQPALSSEARAEVARILARSVGQAKVGDDDRAYLAQLVSTRTGLPPDEAQRRVAMVEGQARDAADKASKAGALFSFWTFMSLLFGGAAATLAGMLGGQLRDAEGRLAAAD
jgi:hypothetical protein